MSSGPLRSLEPRVDGLGLSATLEINERSNALMARGETVYKLGLGQSPFPVPDSVAEALRRNAGQKDYLPVRGLPALREAVAAHQRRVCGLDCSADDVLIGPGSKELLFLLQVVYDAQLVLPNPSWVSYEPQARIAGRDVLWVNADRGDRWRMQPDALASAVASEPGRPRVLLLNYPSNPTGATYSREHLKAIARVAQEHNMLVLSDEIYGELHHEGDHVSIASHYPEGTIVSGGLSKWCGAGGWRLGTFILPGELSWLGDAMACAASETFTSTSAPIQHAAIEAFKGNDEIERYLHLSRGIVRDLGRWIAGELRSAGAAVDDPEGGFYLFPDFEPLGEALTERGIRSSADLTRRCLEEAGVAFLPGSCFGRPAEERTARIAYVNFDGEQALAEASERGDEDAGGLAELPACASTREAVTRLADWLRG